MNARKYFILPLVAAGSVSLSSCGKKDAPQQTETPPTEAVSAVVEKVVQEAAPKRTVNDIAAKAGFAQHMAKDTAVMWALYDGAGMAKKLRATQLGVFLDKMLNEQGQSIDDLLAEDGFQTFADIAGEEVFVALGGEGVSEMEQLVKFSSKSNFYQCKSIVKMVAASVGGDAETMAQSLQSNNYLAELAQDPQMLEVAEAVNVPPVFMGFKVTDKDKRQKFVEQLKGFGEMALSMQEEDEAFLDAVSKDAFSGIKVNGEKLVALMKSDESALQEFTQAVGEKQATAYLAALEKKNVFTLAGELGDYVVIFAGASLDQLDFADSATDSLLAHKDMQFALDYADKELAGLLYMNQEYAELSIDNASYLKDILTGVKAGLADVDSLGDTRVLEALLDDCVKCETAYFAPYKAGRVGMVGYLEDGFKLDSFYTGNAPAANLSAKRHLSKLAAMPEVLFSANWVNNPEQVERGMEYIDAVGHTVYQMAKQVGGLDIDDADFKEFKTGFTMVDGMFKQDLLDVWGALRGDLGKGLGAESALLVDIKGELPTVPNIPEAMVKEAKLPRLGYVSTVEDRSKLAASWTSLNGVAESLLQKAKMMAGMDIPMQRPFKSVSDGLTSWTFQIPFTHQNCTPHVSVSDEVFVVGTSPDFATEIAAAYEKEATGEPLAEMHLSFDVARTLADNWLAVLEKNGATMMGEHDYKQFEEALPKLKELLKATAELESISSKSYQQGDEMRSEFHIKMR